MSSKIFAKTSKIFYYMTYQSLTRHVFIFPKIELDESNSISLELPKQLKNPSILESQRKTRHGVKRI